MLSTFLRKLHRLSRRLWVRVALIACLCIVAVLAAKLFGPLIPEGAAEALGADSLDRLLDIIATSMLAVTTFSLTVMVNAHRAAASLLTPRAHRTLLKDTTTQTVLATFVGAWIYSLVAIVLVSTPYFGEREIVALYIGTIFVLVLIVFVLMRWILHLQGVGSLIDTAERMEREARIALEGRPSRAMRRMPGAIPDGLSPVPSPETGFVQALYERSLQKIAVEADARIWIAAAPGAFLLEGEPLAWTDCADEEVRRRIQGCAHMGPLRTSEQDPRFGLIELSEIGSKALSSGINDPGTAIDILGRVTRLLLDYRPDGPEKEARCDRLFIAPLDPAELVRDAYHGISRDGAAVVEVQSALFRRLEALCRTADPELAQRAREFAEEALQRADAALSFEPDRRRLMAAAAWVRG